MEVEEECDQEEEEEDLEREETVEPGEAEAREIVTLSIHSVKGFTPERSMKMKGMIGDREVVVLIDSGATRNFISQQLVDELGLPVAKHKNFGVKVAGGHIINGKGKCAGLVMTIHGIEIMNEFLLLDLGETTDVVLGYAWLETLGETRVHWKHRKLSWKIGDTWVTIVGDPALSKEEISLNSMERVIKHKEEVYLLELTALFESQGKQDNETHASALQPTLTRYKQIFELPKGLPPTRNMQHAITLLEGTTPINSRPYRYSYVQKDEIEKLVREMLDAQIIRPSVSPYSSPVLLVKKKDGGWRFCVDYRALNKVIVPDRYPIPVIEELLNELKGATMFSKIDLKSGYHQIQMKGEDVEKTAFKTHQGHYEFLVMPFGLTNAPSTFQSIMNDVFRPYLRRFVLVFFDDILVYSPDVSTHQKQLETMLKVLKQHQFYANAKKCSFGNNEVSYLGHIISGEGVAADPEKVEAIVNWPQPKNVTELRGFLGLTGYYRKFVKHYGQIARPLTELLKKGGFAWSETTQAAFHRLKIAVTTIPVLALPDFGKPFTIETDASGEGVGVVLSQEKRPVAYLSVAFSTKGRIKSVYERELLAIVKAVEKWKHYLTALPFVIKTDQRSLRHLLEQKSVSTIQQRWASKLLGLNYRIEYKPGVENRVADALSRRPPTEELRQLTLTAPFSLDIEELKSQMRANQEWGSLIISLENGEEKPGIFTLLNGILYREGRLVIPSKSSLIPTLLHQFHSSAMGGHEGALKTFKRLSQEVFWKGMRKDVVTFIKQCQECQENKYATTSPA